MPACTTALSSRVRCSSHHGWLQSFSFSPSPPCRCFLGSPPKWPLALDSLISICFWRSLNQTGSQELLASDKQDLIKPESPLCSSLPDSIPYPHHNVTQAHIYASTWHAPVTCQTQYHLGQQRGGKDVQTIPEPGDESRHLKG